MNSQQAAVGGVLIALGAFRQIGDRQGQKTEHRR
jgi:hypothetical protein